jgi:hypothetical protein
MSADNYYVVRKHPTGGYTAVMGFASVNETREPDPTDRSWPTVEDVLQSGQFDDSEYGISVHAECGDERPRGPHGCCADRRQPCAYHEGWQDALDQPATIRALAITDAYDRLWAADTRRHDAVMALEDSREHNMAMWDAERALRLLRPATGEPT